MPSLTSLLAIPWTVFSLKHSFLLGNDISLLGLTYKAPDWVVYTLEIYFLTILVTVSPECWQE